MTALDTLLAAPDQTTILNAEVIPALQGAGINTTDWQPGSLTRADAYTAAKLRALSLEQIAVIAAAGFGDYVFGFVPLPNATAAEQADLLSWAPVVAKQVYGVDQIPASRTVRTFTLTNSTGGTYNKAPGSIIVQVPSGNRYVNTASYVSAGNDAVQVSFSSELVNNSAAGLNYNADPSGTTIRFVTAGLPGVTATNPAPAFSPTSQVGPGLGYITLSGTPVTSGVMSVRIDSSGQVSSAAWSVAVDTGAYVSQGTASSATVNGVTITLHNDGGGSSPSFLRGSVIYFTAPGSDITTTGRDAETPQQLGTRCRAVFPLLAFTRDANGNALPISPTAAGYQALVLTAFPSVANCVVVTSSTISNVVNVYIAGQRTLVPAATLAAVQAFLNAFTMITDVAVVASPATDAITLGAGTVKVKAAQLASAKTETQRRVQAYLAGADLASPLPYGGLIDRGYLLSLIRTTPGVTHVDDALTIGGTSGTAAADYQLASATMATYAGDVGSSLTWTLA